MMNSNKNNTTIKGLFLLSILVLAFASRFIDLPAGLSPLTAIALFAGAYFWRSGMSYIATLGLLFVSNLILNNVVYSEYFEGFVWFSNWEVYAAMALIILAARFALKKVSPLRVAATSLVASFVFFLVTNFVVWTSGTMYTMDFAGLIACYEAAVPFYRNAMVGDLFFAFVLFGSYEAVSKWVPALQLDRAR